MDNKNEMDIKEEDLKEEDFTPEELEDEDVDWKAKAQELKGIAKRRATQLEKAKAKLSDYEKRAKEEPAPQTKIDNSQPSEPDYAKLAFLKQEGVIHPDDQKWVQEEATRLKLPLTDILAMAHAKSYLETSKTQREAMAGMPKGKGSASSKTQQDVDYWLAKGETPDDLELAEKVINARMQKEKAKNMFADELYAG